MTIRKIILQMKGMIFIVKENKTIGFIGTGVMGRGMVSNLINANYTVNIYTRTKEKSSELVQLGAQWKNNIADLTKDSDIIITMVGNPIDVEEVYFSEKGIFNNAEKEMIFIDMTTSKPSLAKRIYEEALTNKGYALDAPVSGGENGAKKGLLTIMVGGDESIYNKVLPVLHELGQEIVLMGNAGSGQYTKMCNQIGMAANMIGVCEAIISAKRAGMDPKHVIQTISSGSSSSWVMKNLANQMIDGNYEPGFYVKHLIKDLRIALETAQEMDISTPGLELSLSLFEQLSDMGEEDNGTRAIMKLYDENLL